VHGTTDADSQSHGLDLFFYSWRPHFQREPGLAVAAGRAVTAPEACLLPYTPPCRLVVLLLKDGIWLNWLPASLVLAGRAATPDTRDVCGTLDSTSLDLQAAQRGNVIRHKSGDMARGWRSLRGS
jgi:hypothetical protein